MRVNAGEYEPIEDFGIEARRRLVETRRDEILMLLDRAFSDFVDAEPSVSLASFGFRGDDPVAEAVTWAVDRFASADIDPARLHPHSRSFRLFTEVRFWLAQKVGRAAYDRLISAGHLPEEGVVANAGHAETNANAAALVFAQALAQQVPAFRNRTCADIVAFWLLGTKRLRRDWFGWHAVEDLSEASTALSKKQRSIYTYDAMFRFLCCFHHLVPVQARARAEHTYELTSLSGCPDAPPYRVADRAVLARLDGVSGPREVARLRKEGARILLVRCLDHASGSEPDQLAAVFTRHSLGPTTLHALDLEHDEALRSRIAEGQS